MTTTGTVKKMKKKTPQTLTPGMIMRDTGERHKESSLS